MGTTPETAFTVTFVAGAEVIFNSQTPYTGVEIFNRNTLNVQGGKFDELGFQAHDNSVINLSGGSGFGSGAYYGASDFFNVAAFDNSVINFNGATYCNRISAFDTATINVNGANSNGIPLQNVGVAGNANVNINPGADVRSVSGGNIVVNGGRINFLASGDSCTVNAGEISSTTVVAGTTNILGGSIASLNAGEFGNGTHYDGVSNVRGGTIGTIANGDFSTINIYGGAISDISTREDSVTNIYGGTIGHNTLFAENNGIVNLYGTGLGLTAFSSSGSYNEYVLSGTLTDGRSITGVHFVDYNDGGLSVQDPNAGTGSLRFVTTAAAPEPGTSGLLAVAGVPLLVGVARRRK